MDLQVLDYLQVMKPIFVSQEINKQAPILSHFTSQAEMLLMFWEQDCVHYLLIILRFLGFSYLSRCLVLFLFLRIEDYRS